MKPLAGDKWLKQGSFKREEYTDDWGDMAGHRGRIPETSIMGTKAWEKEGTLNNSRRSCGTFDELYEYKSDH